MTKSGFENEGDPKRYPVDTLEQMAEIPLDALPRFLDELPSLLAHVIALKKLNEIMEPLGAPVQLQPTVWIDDHKRTGTVTIRNSENGEEVMRVQHDTRTGERKL